MANTNTTETMRTPGEQMLAKISAELEITKQKFSKEKLVEISIPESYKSRIGQTWFGAINGVRVVLPVDGTKHKVPESFANLWYEYQNNLTL